MTTLEFSLLALQHMEVYLVLWLALFVLYRLLFWKIVKSILDPIYFAVIFTNSICTANVLFLAIYNEIKLYYTLTYLFSEAALLLGILIFARPQQVLPPQIPSPDFVRRLKFGILFTMAIAISANMMIYINNGIPLLLDSRNDASAGGFGALLRLSQVATALFVLFYYIKKKITGAPNSKKERFLFLISIILGALSGYKAFFLFYISVYFFTNGYTLPMSLKKKIFFATGALIVMLFMFSVVLETTEIGLLVPALLTRLLASGDVYYMAFVKDTIDMLPPQGFFYQLFGSLLASFRVVSWDVAPLNYGYAINEVVNKNDLLFGPTFRYNVLWLLLTKSPILTVMLSFVVGAIIGLLNRALYRSKKLGLSFIIIAFFYFKSFLFILGPDHAINDIVLSATLFIIIGAIVFLPVYRKRNVPVVSAVL
ncbi:MULTISPECIES: hypothetical protein [unclassified Janthinobacterium]|uniref:hypothetical protein n=1 Tax=unclassified Janthinobacterium TaxID=2610881 RepID=UPI001610D08A|nr:MULTISPECIES: hypothetical protein [unclassified Janthinobacterium]MBB5371100.1 hypothetical protein [Janthinobacterium sp. K2C7]MBB5383906.1 hypothetical protein [Janthinobacterium sp. K2Li3]MBB5389272.1 hypothetical protein [Janthinobacterium sp. K2E3]